MDSTTQPQSTAIGTKAPVAPSPILFFETIRAFQQSVALKAAIDIDLFTAIAEGASTVSAIALRCSASERGVRIVADYLAALGFLTKEDGRYALTNDSFMFLNRRSPAYVGSAANFLFDPDMLALHRDFTTVVREGTSPAPSLEPENPMWVNFARSMAPLMAMPAQLVADLLGVSAAGHLRVLDIAAGHGLFGIAVARQNLKAEITAVDWKPVLEVAKENAGAAGVTDRYRTIGGDALSVDLGSGYDLALVTNFLHHFDEPTIVSFMKKIHGTLREGGRAAALEFVPNEERTEPKPAVAFSLTMLAVTPHGDAYTARQLGRMFEAAGFRDVRFQALEPTFQTLVTAAKR